MEIPHQVTGDVRKAVIRVATIDDGPQRSDCKIILNS